MVKLIRFLKPYWKSTLLTFIFIAIQVWGNLEIPDLTSKLVNDGLTAGNLDVIKSTAFEMIAVSLISLAAAILATITSSMAAQSAGTDLRHEIFERVQDFSFKNLDDFETGSLITRLTTDITQLQNMAMMALRLLVRSPLLAIGALISVIRLNAKMSLILAVAIPLLFISIGAIVAVGIPSFMKAQKKLDKVNTVLEENLTGIRVVKAFVRAKFEESRFFNVNTDFRDLSIKGNRIMSLIMPILMLIMNFTVVAIIWFGGLGIKDGTLDIGELMAVMNYIMQVMMAILLLSMMFMFMSRAKVSADRVNEVLAANPDIKNNDNAQTTGIKEGIIEFKNVSLTYDGDEKDQVLTDISFIAEPGKTTAILGSTGSGKSSLVNLIPRFYDVTKGSIEIDGIDIKRFDLHYLRSNIGTVLQESVLFAGTLRDNIKYGREDVSDEEMLIASKAACAHDFISETKEGYDRVIGQKGAGLSGGQRQRVAIARALILKPNILIFDDSTSAVDVKTDAKIQSALKEQLGGTTTLLIAQRISTVRNADKIIVIDDGKIVAEGDHDTLIKNSSIYQEIYESQLKKEDIIDE